MLTVNMTPDRFRERLRESEDRVDRRELAAALVYVREDGRQTGRRNE